jgi:hypothetical protein
MANLRPPREGGANPNLLKGENKRLYYKKQHDNNY